MAQARFMGRWDLPQLLNKLNSGVRFAPGRHLDVKNSCKNTVIVGTVGSGKSSTQIIPNLLNANANYVVSDLSGELYQKTSGWLASQGYRIFKLDFEQPGQSHGMNLLLRNRHDHHALQRIASTILAHEYPKEKSFWTSDASALINLVFRALAEQGDESLMTFSNAEYLINNIGEKSVDGFMAYHLTDPRLFSKYKAIRSYGDNQRAGVTATASAALGPFGDPATARITGTDNLDLEAFNTGKAALFICVPENKQGYYSLIISLIAETIFDALMARPVEGAAGHEELPFTLLALDEFGQLYLPSFPNVCTTLRKRKCGIMIALQDFGQLSDKYGQAAARTMLSGGLVSKLILPGLGVETCEAISRTLGQTTVQNDTASRQTIEPLLYPDEIRMLEQSKALLIHGNQPPIRLEKVVPYFQDAGLKQKTALPPASIESALPEPRLLDLAPYAGQQALFEVEPARTEA